LRDFVKVFKEAGETSAVILHIDGKKVSTLIHEVQLNPVNGNVEHVDFLIIDMKKEIEVPVPIEFEGVAPAEKNGLGTVVKSLHEVEVRALPDAMPHAIHVSIDSLATLDDQIRVSDLVLPAGVTVITDGEEIVASVAAFVEETEDAAPIDLSALEVEKKGKKESDEDAE
jgi:large subunit ribosomal protein L25